jgi:hypothetical protein
MDIPERELEARIMDKKYVWKNKKLRQKPLLDD